eukprot:746182_1
MINYDKILNNGIMDCNYSHNQSIFRERSQRIAIECTAMELKQMRPLAVTCASIALFAFLLQLWFYKYKWQSYGVAVDRTIIQKRVFGLLISLFFINVLLSLMLYLRFYIETSIWSLCSLCGRMDRATQVLFVLSRLLNILFFIERAKIVERIQTDRNVTFKFKCIEVMGSLIAICVIIGEINSVPTARCADSDEYKYCPIQLPRRILESICGSIVDMLLTFASMFLFVKYYHERRRVSEQNRFRNNENIRKSARRTVWWNCALTMINSFSAC